MLPFPRPPQFSPFRSCEAMAAEGEEDKSGVDGEEEAEGEEAVPSKPSHEPFSFNLLCTAHSQQSLNGLRHNDQLRYRQYCSRRLRRLYKVLRFKHGRGRFRQVAFPSDFSDTRFLLIPLVMAERAWSFGMQLKADNAAAQTLNPRWRHHAIQRFAKATQHARMLENVCKIHCDQRTQLEAEAYTAFLEGTLLLEKEKWDEALQLLTRCKRLCEHLGLASDQASGAVLKAKGQELTPMIRECRYNLGLGHHEDDDEVSAKPTTGSRDVSDLSFRGHHLSIPSAKIKGKLDRCLQIIGSIKASEEGSSSFLDQFGELSMEFSDALRDIHTDMIAAGAQGQTSEWRMLEAFARELSVSMSLERNLLLLWKHLQKLQTLSEITSAEARKLVRPEEGMRFSDLLKEDILSLEQLPETNEAISRTLESYSSIVKNCRCLFLALCNSCIGKQLEGAALMDMLHSRVEDTKVGKALPDPLARLHGLFEKVQAALPGIVAKWRCLGLAKLAMESETAASKDEVTSPRAEVPEVPDAAVALGAFPPRFREVACKPLLFDLAFPCIEQPALDQLLKSAAGEGSQRGFLGRVAGGLGNRLGGLWGGGRK